MTIYIYNYISMDTFINDQIIKTDFNIIQKILQTEKYIKLKNKNIAYLKPSEEIEKKDRQICKKQKIHI